MSNEVGGPSSIERVLRLIGTPFLVFLLVLVIILVWVITNLSKGVSPILPFVAVLLVIIMFAVFGFVLELQKRRLDNQERRLRSQEKELNYDRRTIDAFKDALREKNEQLSWRNMPHLAEDQDKWDDG